MGGLAGQPGQEWITSSNSAPCSRACTDTSVTDFSETLSERFESLELTKDVNISTLDEGGKVAELKTIFPTLTEFDIRYSLKKVAGDFTKACEDLLNTQYLEENGLRPKGIDAAFLPDYHILSRKGKNPTVPKDCILFLLWLTLIIGRPENTNDRPGKTRLDLAYNLKPVNLSEDNVSITSPAMSTVKSPTRTNSLSRSTFSSGFSPRSATSAPDSPAVKPTDWRTVQPKSKPTKTYSELAVEAAAAQESTSSSFLAAQQAWRRGKSDSLFRPVAGVLAERAREQLEISKAVNTEKYEALVDEQSSAGHIDLHGVPVSDGVRIALLRTQAWWASLGENRAKRAREEGFIVVTGLGNHSTSGVSRLRQEVGAALKREGWRVRTETGQFVVTGKT